MNETKHNTNPKPQPGSPDFTSRRRFIQTAAALGSLAAVPASAAVDDTGKDKSRTAPNQPLAQDYVVAFRVPHKHAVMGPAMAVLPDGKYVAAVEIKDYARNTLYIAVLLSQDKGKTWEKVCEKPWASAHLFLYDNRLYMFTRPTSGNGVWVTATSDEGRNWAEPVEVIKGIPAAGHAGVVVRDGWLYCAITTVKKMGAIACNLGKGLLNPEAWIESNLAEMPIPDALVSGSFTDGLGAVHMRTVEGNIVDVYGRMLLIARACINHYGTQNMAAVFDLKNENGKLTLTFTQLYPLPGGQNRFHILWDEPSQLFWMASTYATNSQDLIHAAKRFPDYKPSPWHPLREDRRILMLSYSLDSLNWFQAGCIAKAEKMNQAFNSPILAIDGKDMIILSRTSLNAGNFHDADLATFHRVRDFRSLAMDIQPKV
ncbi:exo-alpha-sialidase [bacterium]|nr:exo-alpha-sialidase [bacterium]